MKRNMIAFGIGLGGAVLALLGYTAWIAYQQHNAMWAVLSTQQLVTQQQLEARLAAHGPVASKPAPTPGVK